MTTAFYSAVDSLGAHSYFQSLAAAEAFQAAFGGYVLETTPHRIWRVTLAA